MLSLPVLPLLSFAVDYCYGHAKKKHRFTKEDSDAMRNVVEDEISRAGIQGLLKFWLARFGFSHRRESARTNKNSGTGRREPEFLELWKERKKRASLESIIRSAGVLCPELSGIR